MINSQDLDTTTQPGDDFYQYANGGWVAHTELPKDEPRIGHFNILRKKTQVKVDQLLQSLNIDDPNPNFQTLKKFYMVAMDETAVENQGLSGIQEELNKIANLESHEHLPDVLGQLHRSGIYPFWRLSFDFDSKDSTRYVTNLSQGGLTMPDRDYYLVTDGKMENIRKAFLEFSARLQELSGHASNAKNNAQEVFTLERQIAEFSWTQAQCRDLEKMHNIFETGASLDSRFKFNFSQYLSASNLSSVTRINVNQVDVLEKTCLLVSETPLEIIKTYLRHTVLSTMSYALTHEFVNARFEFFSKTISGTQEIMPRWRRVGQLLDILFEQHVGELYVSKYFSQTAKTTVENMVEKLKQAFHQRLKNLTWMSEETKEQALIKLKAMRCQIGFPDKYRSLSTLNISDNFAENCISASQFNFDYEVSRLDKPADREEWFMGAHTINACYVHNLNVICFPAGILQDPFFDLNNSMAENYGGIGSVIGHEITHGFDDQGRLFNSDGNMSNWWQPQDKQAFDSKASELSAQYAKIEIQKGANINALLTQGENIADLGGLTMALDAFQLAEESESHKKPLDSKNLQNFFMSYAKVWAVKQTTEYELMLVKVDPHSPNKYRVNIPTANCHKFYESFAIPENAKNYLNPSQRVSIW